MNVAEVLLPRAHTKIVNHYEIIDRLRRVFLDGYNIFKRSKKSRVNFFQTSHLLVPKSNSIHYSIDSSVIPIDDNFR